MSSNSNARSLKMTGTLWDILREREQDIAKKAKNHKLGKVKREQNNNTAPYTKKSTKECYWKIPRDEIVSAETHNIWNLPFKPVILHPASEINARYDPRIQYKLIPHKIVTKIDYSSVKSAIGINDPRLCRDDMDLESPKSNFFNCP